MRFLMNIYWLRYVGGIEKREKIKKNTPVNRPGFWDGDYFIVGEQLGKC